MFYSVGYNFIANEILDGIVRNRNSISEIYFSFADFPNGRAILENCGVITEWEAINKQIEDLKKINLVLNSIYYLTAIATDATHSQEVFFIK